MQFLTKLTLNQRLAVLAFVLGAVALAATPMRGGRLSIDPREAALIMQHGADRVDARVLAGWIIESRSDVRLIDLREPAAFAAGPRIPSSENIPAGALLDAGLGRDERILLVADDDARAGQAWVLLRAAGFTGVTLLRGGLRAWQDEVVFPRVDGLSGAERAMVESVSAHFGGSPRTGPADGTTAAPSTALVQSAPPALPPTSARKPAPAKKKEGC